MGYVLGVDLGTTYTGAAVVDGGRAEVVALGNRSPVVPTVVFLGDQGTMLFGDAANRRALSEPGKVAREFKRRVGDTAPILLGGTPLSPQSLMARMLRWVVDAVSEQRGEPPAHVAASHPANWGPYKLDLFEQAVRLADLSEVTTISEPEAAAAYYAAHARMDQGEAVAVYDLGGGTFDAAVVRRTPTGFDTLGSPEGIEHLGGIDIDEAVFAHVSRALDGALEAVDPRDPTTIAALARLRQECVEAKEALSSDVEVDIPVLLPGVQTQVRMTRSQLEEMIRPSLVETISALQRALRSAAVGADDVRAVLLVGGSSRIPLVSRLVGEALGRPVAVDAHPKHCVALGAALAGDLAVGGTGLQESAPTTRIAPLVVPAGSERTEAVTPAGERTEAVTAGTEPTEAVPAAAEPTRAVADTGLERFSEAPAAPDGFDDPPSFDGRRSGRWSARSALVVVLAALALVVAGVMALRGGPEQEPSLAAETEPGTGTGAEQTLATPEPTAEPTAEPTGEPTGEPTAAEEPEPDEPTEEPTVEPSLPPAVCDGTPCIRIDEAGVEAGELVVAWTPEGFDPAVTDTHAHFYWDVYEPNQVGTNAAALGAQQAPWELTDARPFVPQAEMRLSNRPEAATGFCVTAADAAHAVIKPENYHCVPLPTDT